MLAFLTLNTAIRFRLAASSHCVYIACHNSLRILTQKTLKLILTVVLLLGFYYYDDYDDDYDDDDVTVSWFGRSPADKRQMLANFQLKMKHLTMTAAQA